MPPIFCFIDDSSFELDLFARTLIPQAPDLEFVLGQSYGQVREKLGERHPCLFLLDLYGADPNLSESRLPSREELEGEIAGFGGLDEVYQGLADYRGDRTNEFLKRLFRLTDQWRNLFHRVSRLAGQNINYGLENLMAARRDYPAAAMIGFTRKALIGDAVEVMAAGMDGLFLKPNAPTDEAIAEAFEREGPGLIESWSAVVTNCFSSYLKDLSRVVSESGFPAQKPFLTSPDDLSAEALALLGPGDVSFLQAAADWWAYTGQPSPT